MLNRMENKQLINRIKQRERYHTKWTKMGNQRMVEVLEEGHEEQGPEKLSEVHEGSCLGNKAFGTSRERESR